MKTLNYLPTLLALTIQVMVSGQTQGNQARVIRVDIMGSKQPVKMQYSNSNVTISISEYNQLLEQANLLKLNAKSLRTEAIEMESQLLNKQIEASEFFGKISVQQFDQNKDLIIELFTSVPKNKLVYSKAQHFNSDSERFMKLAKEMREEAKAQLSLQATYGEMTNAEENEALAIAKQQEVIKLLQSTTAQLQVQKSFLANNTANPIVNPVCVAHIGINETQTVSKFIASGNLMTEALVQLQDLNTTIQQLKLSTLNASVKQKAILLIEVASLENDVVFKKLEISSFKAKEDYQTFNQNRIAITTLLDNMKDNSVLLNRATELNNEAEHLMKIGKEQREEANAQLTLAAKFGAMSNAQETETLALRKQHDVLQVIDKHSSRTIIASR